MTGFRSTALFALIVFAANALALSPNEWRFRQPPDVPAAGLVRIDLPPATLDAAQLPGEEKSIAVFGPEAPVAKQPHREAETPAGTGGIVFWIVLALVVAGLLVVLARMLPRPPDAAP